MSSIDALIESKKFDIAAAHLAVHLIHEPTDRRIIGRLALCLLEMGRLGAAERLLRRILRTFPDDVATLANLGFVLLRTGSSAEALRTIQRGLIGAPNHFDLTMGSIDASTKQGMHDRAISQISWLQRLLSSSPHRRYSALSVGAMLADAVAWQLLGERVHHGPFAGMKYLDHDLSLSKASKLIGCYEAELHPAIAALSRYDYDRQVHIGCAEGYYAVGVARLRPDIPAIAVDIDPKARAAVAAAAKANDIDLGVADRFDPTLLGEGTLVICDCEGDEVDLLTQPTLDRRKIKAMIVETHPVMDGQSDRSIRLRTLVDAFAATHSLQVVSSPTPRDSGQFPALLKMPEPLRSYVAFEGRGAPTPWLIGRLK